MGVLDLVAGVRRKVRLGETIEGGFIVQVTFDASISETHEGANEVTRHPVEEGTDITDHVRRQPERLTINGIISNTPLILGAFATESPSRAEEGYEVLKELKDKGTPISILTTLRQYDNMIIEGMTITRDVMNGNVLNATLSLVEIQTAETVELEPDPAAGSPSTKGRGNKGRANTQAASPARKSSFAAAVDAITGG